jgi:hypothetical protein
MQRVYFTPDTRVLRGLDEIGRYLKVHRRTKPRQNLHYISAEIS